MSNALEEARRMIGPRTPKPSKADEKRMSAAERLRSIRCNVPTLGGRAA